MAYAAMRRRVPPIGGWCRSGTTSPRTCAIGIRARRWRWSTSTGRGRCGRCAGASCRISPAQAANVLAALGVGRGDRVAVVLPPTPETAAVFFATWKLGALLLSMSVLYGDEGIRHRLGDSQPAVLVTDAANAGRFPAGIVPACSCSTSAPSTASRRGFETRGHRGRRPGAALLHLRHDRAREGDRPRAPLPARARGVRLLPRRPARASASTGWASGRGRRGSRRCWAPGGAARCSASTSARRASTRTASSRSSRATRWRTCSRRRRRSAR